MRWRPVPWAVALALVALLAGATAAPVLAADPAFLVVEAPAEVGLGDSATITATLRDGQGSPIPKVTLLLRSPTSFLGTEDEARLGEALTDREGRATFTYKATREKGVTLRVYFAGNSRYAPAQASVELKVLGSAQLYEETAGVRVPGIGVWMLVGLLGIVWSVYIVVMVLVTLVARAAPKATEPGVEGSRG